MAPGLRAAVSYFVHQICLQSSLLPPRAKDGKKKRKKKTCGFGPSTERMKMVNWGTGPLSVMRPGPLAMLHSYEVDVE